MKPNAGRLVSYINPDGKRQQAIMRHADQKQEVQGKKKAALRLLDDKLKVIMDGDKERTALVAVEKLTIIGMTD